MFSISADGRTLIQGTEKLATTVYYDPDVATIGYGHAIVMNGHQVSIKALGRAAADQQAQAYMMSKFGKTTITDADAQALFNEDMASFTKAVNAVCDASTYQCEFDAMVSFAFNCGVGGFNSSSVAKFHKANQRTVGDISMSDLATWSKGHSNPTNIQQAFAAWSKDNGAWELGLYRRRLEELLVYAGHKAAEAYTTAWSFKG